MAEHVQVPDPIRELARRARRVVVLTGAGMSAESGVPTYRDAETGLWARYDAQTLSSIDAWDADPELVWTFHAFQAGRLDQVSPNLGHLALARWQRHLAATGGRLDIATQNIDDLHERAGAEVLNHAHGSLRAFHCASCDLPYTDPIAWPDAETERVPPPRCHCGGLVRPGVVMFGEALPVGSIEMSARACENADLVLVIGTSSVVYPFAALPYSALNASVPVIEINPNPTGLSEDATHVWRAPAAGALNALVTDVMGGGEHRRPWPLVVRLEPQHHPAGRVGRRAPRRNGRRLRT